MILSVCHISMNRIRNISLHWNDIIFYFGGDCCQFCIVVWTFKCVLQNAHGSLSISRRADKINLWFIWQLRYLLNVLFCVLFFFCPLRCTSAYKLLNARCLCINSCNHFCLKFVRFTVYSVHFVAQLSGHNKKTNCRSVSSVRIVIGGNGYVWIGITLHWFYAWCVLEIVLASYFFFLLLLNLVQVQFFFFYFEFYPRKKRQTENSTMATRHWGANQKELNVKSAFNELVIREYYVYILSGYIFFFVFSPLTYRTVER